MTPALFDFLMVFALGALAGTGIGLIIGYLTGNQSHDWAAMSGKEKTTNILLILIFSFACIAVLAWYALQ